MTLLAQFHRRCHWRQPLSQPSTTAISLATQLTTATARSQWLFFVTNRGNGGHCSRKQWSIVAAAMVVFVDGGCCQQRWDRMEGQWCNGIGGNGVFGRWWPWQWQLSSSTVQQRSMPPPPSHHWPWRQLAEKPLPPPPSTATSIGPKTIATSAMLYLIKLVLYHFTEEPPCFYDTNRKPLKIAF
jgi:hypothetical protein